MRELLIEIFESLKKNKLRTFLTGFSVAWGIFMLVVLLGAGNGLMHGMLANFGTMMVNSGQIYGGYTSIGYGGFSEYRWVTMDGKDIDIIRNEFSDYVTDNICPVKYFSYDTAAFKTQTMEVSLKGVVPGYMPISGSKLSKGRYINDLDMRLQRKSCVIDENLEKVLFRDGEDPVGKRIFIGKFTYTVIGVVKNEGYGAYSEVLVPFDTGVLLYSGGDNSVSNIAFEFRPEITEKDAAQFEQRLRERLSKKHGFSPEDVNAFYISNNMEFYKDLMKVFRALDIFIWMIGFGTLFAGIVGVSNIMLVSVRERTTEIGIRKALGASPRSIVMLVIVEAITITSLFGYIGMCLGVGTMEVVNIYLSGRGDAYAGTIFEGTNIFKDPTVEMPIVLSATIVLVISGIVAGYIPAKRAAAVKTIDALRDGI